MINVSNDLLTDVNSNDNRHFVPIVTITLADSTVLNIQPTDIWNGGLSIEECVSDDSNLDVGSVRINQCTLVLNNMNGAFDAYDFAGAEVNVQLSLALTTGVTETFQRGIYWVDGQDFNQSLVTLTCLDALSKFDGDVSASSLVYPATLLQIAQDICAECGHSLATATFPNYTLSFAENPFEIGTTYRTALMYVAQVAGCNAYANQNGLIEFKWYDVNALSTGTGLVDIPALYTLNTAMDDSVITGVKAVLKDAGSSNLLQEFIDGVAGNTINIEGNPLVTAANAQTIVDAIGNVVIGMTYRKGNFTHLSAPYIQAGDVAAVYDRAGNEIRVIISYTQFTILDRQQSTSAGATPARNMAERYSEQIQQYLNVAPEISEALQEASSAKTIADNTDQYFWFTSTGADTGAHITSIPQDQFVNTPAGGNTLIRSNGIAIRNALDELATFSSNGVRVGLTDDVGVSVGINETQFHGKDHVLVGSIGSGNTSTESVWYDSGTFVSISHPTPPELFLEIQFPVIDFTLGALAFPIYYILSGTSQLVNETFAISQNGSITSQSGNITADYEDGLLKVYWNSSTGCRYKYAYQYNIAIPAPTFMFGTASSPPGDFAFSIGNSGAATGYASFVAGKGCTASGQESTAIGQSNTASGHCSFAEGSNTESIGLNSHAEGNSSVAEGNYSHAQNLHTLAESASQTALGKYNVSDSADTYAVIVGNGSSDNSRSDALEVEWGGNVRLALDTAAGTGTTDGDLYAAITALGWGSGVIS